MRTRRNVNRHNSLTETRYPDLFMNALPILANHISNNQQRLCIVILRYHFNCLDLLLSAMPCSNHWRYKLDRLALKPFRLDGTTLRLISDLCGKSILT